MEFSNLLFVIVLYSSIGAPQQTETKDGKFIFIPTRES